MDSRSGNSAEQTASMPFIRHSETAKIVAKNNNLRGTTMDTRRRAAILIGLLFIIGTIFGGTSAALTDPIRNDSNVLAGVYSHESRLVLAAVFWLTMGLALALVPVVAYPVLSRYNRTLAIGYVIFRGGLETCTYIVASVGWLMLIPLCSVYQAGPPDTSLIQSLGTAVFNAHEISSAGTIVFRLGALMFYYVLYRHKLIPRWISGWGLLAAIPYLAGGILGFAGLLAPTSPVVTAMDMPSALQEMAMAIWFIAKGFTPATLPSERAA
jgi:hypothetical protein